MSNCLSSNSLPSPVSARLSLWGLAVLLTGAFVVVFDVFVVNVAVPSLKADLNADLAETGMVIAVYALSFGASLVVGGRLGDIFGRRRIFSLGMASFAIASLLCGLAPTPAFLIAARVMQGFCAALLFPQVYAILRVLHDEAGRARAFGLLGMTLGLAAIAGQLLGGLMIWSNILGFGWRIVFFINLPIGIGAAALACTIPESRVPEPESLDLPGALLAVIGLGMLLIPLLEGPSLGWPTWTWISIVATIPVCGLFFRRETHIKKWGAAPIVDFHIFGNRAFCLSTCAVTLVYSTPTCFFLCFSFTLQTGLGLTPLEAGGMLTPMSIGFILASLSAPKLFSRFGSSAVTFGMGVYAIGFLWLGHSTASLDGGLESIPYLLGMMAFGFGQGLSGPPLLNIAIGGIEKERAGMASGIISTVQQLGGAFGIALAGVVFADVLSGAKEQATAHQYAQALSDAMFCDFIIMLIASGLLILVTNISIAGKEND